MLVLLNHAQPWQDVAGGGGVAGEELGQMGRQVLLEGWDGAQLRAHSEGRRTVV